MNATQYFAIRDKERGWIIDYVPAFQWLHSLTKVV